MKVVGKADSGQWIKATNDAEKVMAKACTLGMREVGKRAVKGARDIISAAGFSNQFARSFQAINTPKTGYVLNPHIYLHSTVNFADVFVGGRTIQAKGDSYLWLPTENVPPNPKSGGFTKFGGIVGRSHMTPSQYTRRVGRLVRWNLIGKKASAVLVDADKVEAIRAGEKVKRKRRRKGIVPLTEGTKDFRSAIMFVGFKSITIPAKFNVETAVDNASGQFQSIIDAITDTIQRENV